MRKPLAAVTAALILLGGTQLPAWAAEPPPPPTDVQVNWLDLTAGTFKVTWNDGGEANWVRLEYEDIDAPLALASVKADAPNEITRSKLNLYGNKVARIVVVTRGEPGVESIAAFSPWFDTNHPAVATLVTASALADGSVRMKWLRGTAAQDTTPNDPLDRPSADEKVVPAIEPPSGAVERFPVPAEATTATVPARPRPYRVRLRTENEWGVSVDDYHSTIRVTTLTAAFGIPAIGQYSSTVRFTAEVGSPECSGAVCGYGPVSLQARADATKPWVTIGTYNAEPPKFSAAIGVYGGRQYRLSAPAWSHNTGDIAVAPPISTSARYSAAQAKFSVVGFNTTSASVGQLVKATVNVLPAGSVKADLQWFDGKVWRHGAYIPLTKGKGTLTIKAAGRGTTRSWRVTVPKMTMNGLPIVATASRAFKLTVR
jgi:hypothetical protein